MNEAPLAYFITWTCYGTWLIGDEPGSVDREHNRYGEPFIVPQKNLRVRENDKLRLLPFELDERARELVLEQIVEVCAHRKWRLHAAHIRSNHLHVIVTADDKPEKVMGDLKAYSTRKLRDNADDGQKTRDRYWTKHGSTRYLWNEDSFHRALKYVLEEQGKPMCIYPASEPRASATGGEDPNY